MFHVIWRLQQGAGTDGILRLDVVWYHRNDKKQQWYHHDCMISHDTQQRPYNILVSNMYLIAIQLFVFIVGNQPGAILKWNCCRSLKPSRSVQCRHWWYLGPSNFYFWLVIAMNKQRYTPENKQTWNPQTLAVFCFLCFSKCFSLSSFGGILYILGSTTLRLTKSFTILDSALRWWTPSSGTPMWSWEDSAQGLCGKQEYRINKNEWQTYSSVLSLNFCEHRS